MFRIIQLALALLTLSLAMPSPIRAESLDPRSGQSADLEEAAILFLESQIGESSNKVSIMIDDSRLRIPNCPSEWLFEKDKPSLHLITVECSDSELSEIRNRLEQVRLGSLPTPEGSCKNPTKFEKQVERCYHGADWNEGAGNPSGSSGSWSAADKLKSHDWQGYAEQSKIGPLKQELEAEDDHALSRKQEILITAMLKRDVSTLFVVQKTVV